MNLPHCHGVTTALALGTVLCAPVRAQDTASTRVGFGAFVDIYHAWDFARPPTGDRSFAGGAPWANKWVR